MPISIEEKPMFRETIPLLPWLTIYNILNKNCVIVYINCGNEANNKIMCNVYINSVDNFHSKI